MSKKHGAILNKSFVSDDDRLFYCENKYALAVLLRMAEQMYDYNHPNVETQVKLCAIRTHLKLSLEVTVIINLHDRNNPCNNNVRIEHFKVKKKELDRLVALEEVGTSELL